MAVKQVSEPVFNHALATLLQVRTYAVVAEAEIEKLRQRVIELEDEIDRLKKQTTPGGDKS